MLMVIFGAGATHGSISAADAAAEADHLEPPPLTEHLLSPRYGAVAARYPSSRPAIVQLRQALAQTPDALIEAEIGNLAESASRDPEFARHLLSLRFYISDVIEGVADAWWEALNGFTYYVELLARIGAWRSANGEQVALVTFNYDTFLDRSATGQAGNWHLADLPSYVDRPDWRLYKLHGSTNWRRLVPTGSGLQTVYSNDSVLAMAHQLNLDAGTLEPGRWSEFGAPRATTEVAVPGIAIPTDRKTDFECDASHIARLRDDIADVDRLLMIGWRATEPHALELLNALLRPGCYHLGIVSPESEAVYANLNRPTATAFPPSHTVANKATSRCSWATFEELLAADDIARWLELAVPAARPDPVLRPFADRRAQ